MAALSGGQINNLRANGHTARFYLSVSQPRTLLTAKVNNGSAARGDTAIIYDNGSGANYSDIAESQVVKVVTASRVEKIRLRSTTGTATSGTVTVAANSIVWADNQDFTVIEDYPLAVRPPRFTNSQFYKDWDLGFSGRENPTPVTICGPHRPFFMSGSSVTVNVDVTNSYAIANGASISSYAVVAIPSTGVTVNVTAGSGTINFTNTGQYWIRFQATDSNGKAQYSYRRYWVHSTDPTNSQYPFTDFEVRTLSGGWDRGGWSLAIQVNGTADTSIFPDEALICLWYTVDYAGSTDYIGGYTDHEQVLFCGYIRKGTVTANWNDSTVQFEATTIDGVMRDLGVASDVVLQAVTSPSDWYQYYTWLTTGRALHHYWRWHSTLFECTDVLGLMDNTTKRPSATFQKGDLYSQAMQVCSVNGIKANIVCHKNGQLYLIQDLQYLNSTARAAATVTAEITTADYHGDITIIDQPQIDMSIVFTNGFTYDGSTVSAVCAKAPGNVPASGKAIGSVPNQIFANQTGANEFAGRIWAAANSPYKEFRLNFNGIWAGVVDIIGDEWWQIDVASSGNKRGVSLTNQLMLARTVNNQIDAVNGYIATSATFEPESVGPDGISYTCPSAPSSTTNEPDSPTWNEPNSPVQVSDTRTVNDTALANFDGTYGMLVLSESSASTPDDDIVQVQLSNGAPGTFTGYESASDLVVSNMADQVDTDTALLSWHDTVTDTISSRLVQKGISLTLGTTVDIISNMSAFTQPYNKQAVLSTTIAVVASYGVTTNSNLPSYAYLTLNTGSLTVTASDTDNSAFSSNILALCPLSSTTALAIGIDNTPIDNIGMQTEIVTCSGGMITIQTGSRLTGLLCGATGIRNPMAQITTDKAILLYPDYNSIGIGEHELTAIVLEVSGTTVTPGTGLPLGLSIGAAGTGDYQYWEIVNFNDGATFGLVYGTLTATYFKTLSVSGTTVTLSPTTQIVSTTLGFLHGSIYYASGKVGLMLYDSGNNEAYYHRINI